MLIEMCHKVASLVRLVRLVNLSRIDQLQNCMNQDITDHDGVRLCD